MLKRKAIRALQVIIVMATINSCVKGVDFDQADNFSITPVIESSIVYIEVIAPRFSENGIEIEFVRDSIANIEIFEDEFIKDNLVKAELVFEAINTINRTFNLQIDLLNSSDELQHTLAFDSMASIAGNEVVTNYVEVFENEDLDGLKLMTKMVLTLTVNPSTDGSMLNEDSTGKVSLKSKGVFYFDINL